MADGLAWRRRLIAVLAAGAAVLGSIAGGGPAQASPASATQTSATWKYIRLTCKTVAAGQACVGLQGNGQPYTYRVQFVLRPKPGQWMRRVAWTTWQPIVDDSFGYDYYPAFSNDGYKKFCTTTCAADTGVVSWFQASRHFAVYSLLFDTPQGRYDVSAGSTVVGTSTDGGCINDVQVSSYLTSTSDGNVWVERQFNVNTPMTNPVLAQLQEHGKALYTVRSSTFRTPYESRHLFRKWQRVRQADGTWRDNGSLRLALREGDGFLWQTGGMAGPC